MLSLIQCPTWSYVIILPLPHPSNLVWSSYGNHLHQVEHEGYSYGSNIHKYSMIYNQMRVINIKYNMRHNHIRVINTKYNKKNHQRKNAC